METRAREARGDEADAVARRATAREDATAGSMRPLFCFLIKRRAFSVCARAVVWTRARVARARRGRSSLGVARVRRAVPRHAH